MWCDTCFLLQIVAESQKRGENALTEKREKVMLELDKLQRHVCNMKYTFIFLYTRFAKHKQIIYYTPLKTAWSWHKSIHGTIHTNLPVAIIEQILLWSL